MGTFSKLLKQSNDASNAVCDNPTKANCRELELVTDLAIQALTEEIKRRKQRQVNASLCSVCYNPHRLMDDDAGSQREIERLCQRCYDSKFVLPKR